MLRDHTCSLVSAALFLLQVASPLEVELCALLDGAVECADRGLLNISVVGQPASGGYSYSPGPSSLAASEGVSADSYHSCNERLCHLTLLLGIECGGR